MGKTWPITLTGLVWAYCLAAFPHAVGAQQGARTAWATAAALDRQLDATAEVQWHDVPLREALQRLGRAQGVAIVLDRCIDPDQAVSFAQEGTRLIDVLNALAATKGCEVSRLPSLLYFGPSRTTRSLASWQALQWETITQMPRAVQRPWRQREVASWPRLTEPRRLLETWLRQGGLKATGLEQVPHDLWRAQELPPLDLLERLTVALAGFELAPQVSRDGSLSIVPLPADVRLTRSFRLSPDRLTEVPSLRQTLPQLDLALDGRTLRASGRLEDLQQLERWSKPSRTRSAVDTSLANKRFTLTVQNQPIEAILAAVARQLDVQLDWHPETQAIKKQRVSLAVENVTLGELLAKVLQDQPATYRLGDGRLTITPLAKSP
jgi:hypothetical protein